MARAETAHFGAPIAMTPVRSIPAPLQSTEVAQPHGLGAWPHIRTALAEDADDHAGHLTNWQQRYDQTTSGPFHGLLEELQLPQMQVFRESTSQGMRQSCCVWPDAVWFGLPVSAQITRLNGRVMTQDHVLVRPGACEFELLTPADYAIYGIVVRQSALQTAADQMGCKLDWKGLNRSEMVQVNSASRDACRQTLSILLNPDRIVQGNDAAQQAVFDTLLPLLDTSEVDGAVSSSFMRRQRIVAKARNYVLAHHDRVIAVPELCQQLFVSRRTLQYCFEDVLGINPVQYLRIIRLNGARRALRDANSPPRTVRDVAADWGFWHFSQFSSDYRKLFGQRPSETLKQGLH